jgi:hypothetical protein
MSTRISAFLGLDVSAFSQGLAKANTAAMNFRKNLAAVGGGNIAGAIGIAALIRGFSAVLNSAQEARDAAREIGKGIDNSTLAVAGLGDAFDFAFSKLKRGAVIAASLPSLLGNFIGQKMGTASSYEEQEALARAELSQKENDIQLEKNKIRLAKEMAQAELALAAATKKRQDVSNDSTDEQKLKRLNKEIDDLFGKMVEMPASIARTKIMTELEKLTAETIELTRKIEAAAKKESSGITLAEAASGTPGRRSERERLAADAQSRFQRSKQAEAAGNMSLASQLKSQGESLAARAGFGKSGEGAMGVELRRGGMTGAVQAQYGGQYKRADSFENSSKAEDAADSLLKQAAEDLKAAAKALESVEVEIDAN